MILKTQGIVLKTIKYNDHKLIAKIYTASSGLQNFFIPVGRSLKSKFKPALFLGLNQLNIEFEHRENKQFANLKDVSCHYQYIDLQTNIFKSSISSFLNEVLLMCIKEEESNKNVFDFITLSFQWLDNTQENVSNFHLYFLIEFSRHLGFYPQNNFSVNHPYFDLREGAFIKNSPEHPHFLLPENAQRFSDLLMLDLKNLRLFNVSKEERSELITDLIQFYRMHISGFKDLKTLSVLKETFS